MSSCFLCGGIDDTLSEVIEFDRFKEAVYSALKEHNVKTVYTCNRNLFDDLCEDAINMCFDWLKLSLIKIESCNSDYMFFQQHSALDTTYSKIYAPITDNDESKKYTRIYDWMVQKSQYMLTFMIDDSDISYFLRPRIEASGVELINLVDYMPSNIISFLNKD